LRYWQRRTRAESALKRVGQVLLKIIGSERHMIQAEIEAILKSAEN
jgi:hypothetical protein